MRECLLLAGLLAMAWSSMTAAAPSRLTVQGHALVAPSGRPIQLRGWNWGHWGTAKPQDARDNAAQGADAVRIPLRWWGAYGGHGVDSRDDAAVATAGIEPAHLRTLDAMVDQASRAGLWIVLFVDSDCGQNGTQDARERAYCDPQGRYPQGHNFWTDADARRRFVDVWRFLARRYRDVPRLGLIEPLPEPNPSGASPAAITAFYDEVLRAVRPLAPGVPFLVGGRRYRTEALADAWNPQWHDVVYTGNLFLHPGAHGLDGFDRRLQALTHLRDARDVPVFVQQVGVRSGEDPGRRGLDAMLGALAAAQVGYTYWEYRGSVDPDAYGVLYRQDGGWVAKQAWLRDIAAHFRQ
jgi:hypothetical protein